MIVLYIILGVIAGLFLLVVIIGYLSPRYVRVTRSIEINTTADKVYDQAISLRNFNENWSPWTELDPEMKQAYSGPENAIGSKYEWKGNRAVGSGTMVITVAQPNKKVIYRVAFTGRGEIDSVLEINQVATDKTHVSWSFEADNKNSPFARFFGRMMDKFVGKDFEKGVNKLKIYLEKGR